MLPNIVLPIISRILNQYLKLDPEIQQRLSRFNNRVLRATITTFDWTFYIKIHDEQLELMNICHEPIDATFKADISTLTKAALQDKAAVLPEMELQGDVSMIQTITTIFKEVEIDWEECLANYTGDMIANKVGQVVREVQIFCIKLLETNKLNVKDYLQEEINLLVSAFEMEDFCKDIDLFRDEIERISAKIQMIENYAKEN